MKRHAPSSHPDPMVLHYSSLFPSLSVVTLVGDPTTAPICKVLSSSAAQPETIPEELIRECAKTCEFGLAILVAAMNRQVADAARNQLVAWLNRDQLLAWQKADGGAQ